MSAFIENFHFIRPIWLMALLVLALILFLLKKYRIKQSSWQSILPAHLAKVLIKESQSQKPFSLLIPAIMGILTIISLAGPAWKKLPQPVYQVAKGSVLIMDLSYSMYSTDLSPNRLTRARFKAIDLLEEINEGEMGLIAYAGDAFTISPLTEDINNIKLLLPSLAPELMPVLGSNPLAALNLAAQTLKNAGHIEGDIYWFTDGIENNEIQDITRWSNSNNYRLNILGVGTTEGAPIKLQNGELMKGNDGAIVLPKLPEQQLAGIASRGRGNFTKLTNSSADINTLVKNGLNHALNSNASHKEREQKQNDNSFGDQWQDAGPYLLIPVLLLLLGYFRRGILLSLSSTSLLIVSASLLSPTPAYAGIWQDLWQTKDQQAQDKFNQQRFEEAATDFSDPLWKGSAHYKSGDFESALAEFKQSDSAQALYNQGNAYAKLQQFDDAIDAYNQALAKQPNLAQANENKALIEALKKQQEQSQDQNGDSANESDNKEQNGEDGSQNGDQQKNQQGEQQNQQSEQQGDNSSQQNSQPDSKQQENTDNEDSAKNEENQSDSEQSSKEQADDKENTNTDQSAEEDTETKKESEALAEATPEQEANEDAEVQKIAAKLAQEKEQKNQQLLNKVTDDPYLLLRNKMQIEYQKRRLNTRPPGEQKQW